MALHEIIRLQRLDAPNIPWDIVLERYASSREGLVRCAESLDVPDTQRQSLGEAIALVSIMIEDIERARAEENSGRLDS
jgi:hypothetical protein